MGLVCLSRNMADALEPLGQVVQQIFSALAIPPYHKSDVLELGTLKIKE